MTSSKRIINKLFIYQDLIESDLAMEYLSHLLNEPIDPMQISQLMWAGHLIGYRSDVHTLQEVTIKDNRVIAFGKVLNSVTIHYMPNMYSAIGYQGEKYTEYACLIKDSKGKNYVALSQSHRILTPRDNLLSLKYIHFRISDLINVANEANNNNNTRKVEKVGYPKKLSFQVRHINTNIEDDPVDNSYYEEFYIVDIDEKSKITNTYVNELPTNRPVQRETILAVTGILLERLINKKGAYKNTNLSQSRIVNDILEKFSEANTLGKRNLDQILAEANKSLKEIKSPKNQKDK